VGSWETEKILNWNKNCLRVICWTQLAQDGNADFYEVEIAIRVPSVLVSLGEGPNTKSVHDITAVNTSVS